MIKPQGKNILLQLIEIINSSIPGFQLSSKSVNGKNPIEEKAVVIAVGDEVTRVKPKDVVYFKEYNIDRIEIGSFSNPTTLAFIAEEHVIAVENELPA